MKILILKGSPHKNGSTALLADAFAKGAGSAGHEVEFFDAAKAKIGPCYGCNVCRTKEDGCFQKDDMEGLNEKLINADLVAFVSPLYYFGMTAQLKLVIDRFYGINGILRESQKKAVLLSAGADIDDWAMDAIDSHFVTMCRYLNWTDAGKVLATGVAVPEQFDGTDYLEKAEKLGESL